MKRVYVETNFLVDLVRPLATSQAKALYARNGVDVALLVPWCSVKEVERTLRDKIIQEDLGFASIGGQVKARLLQRDQGRWLQHAPSIDQFLDEIRALERLAYQNCVTDIERVAATMNVLEPSKRATERALDFSRGKRLKPFDEMILGCVLADAEKHATGSSQYFCSTNLRDFEPTNGSNLEAAYNQAGLTYLKHFKVP